MASSEHKGGTAIAAPAVREKMTDEIVSSSARGADDRDDRPRPQAAKAEGGGVNFSVYKSGQGAHVRWGSVAGASVVALGLAAFLWREMPRFTESLTVRYMVPVIALAGCAWLIFHLFGQRRPVVDFMVATEGEMKKVNWSTRREVMGATRVVIFTVLAFSFIVFAVDILFMLFFSAIKVLRIPVFERFFGGA